MTRLLALDVGDRRVGVAVSDTTRRIASPLAVIHRRSKIEDFADIAHHVTEQGACKLVVGLPLDSEGQVGVQARRIKRYALALAGALESEGLELAIEFWDESLSTRRAQAAMVQSGRRRKDRRARIDAAAAAAILQDYLDARTDGRMLDAPVAPPEPLLGAVGIAPLEPSADAPASCDVEEEL